jgi:three-Cys-motif partner protein
VSDPYVEREQTKVKHFILRHYLQALAFKVLTFSDITYVDGFSGPWETKTEDFSDSSFKIAITVLRDAQKQILAQTGVNRRIRCFLSEKSPEVFAQLDKAVANFHQPEERFEIKTYCGRFEDAVDIIRTFIGSSFPLIFIDPTGWTGYPLDAIGSLFRYRKCEVLINFMYDFINRFAQSKDEEITRSMAPILGGSNWPERLDPNIHRSGLAVEKLFRETLKRAGNFEFVISTKIDRATAERPHFFIVYGTKSPDGLKAFREIEYRALREHEKNRAKAKEKNREQKTGMGDLFTDHEVEVKEATIGEIVEEQKSLATTELMARIDKGPMPFSTVVVLLLQAYMLRETNVKDICRELAKSGTIENTWGGGNRKPQDKDMIRLKAH